MDEIWKPIPGYEGYYEVSNLGRVKSLGRYVFRDLYKYYRKERIRSPYVNQGYLSITLNKDKSEKTYAVHRLVALAFIPNPDNKPAINHIDGNKQNNCVTNLEWVTSAENSSHAVRTGLINAEQCRINGRKAIDVVAIRVQCEDTNELFESVVAAERYLHVGSIADNIHKHTRSHSGRGWLFKIVDEVYYQQHKHDAVDVEACAMIHESIRTRIKYQGKSRKVYCVERDITYPSLSAAAKDNNMNYETINLAIKEDRKAKGLTFKFM